MCKRLPSYSKFFCHLSSHMELGSSVDTRFYFYIYSYQTQPSHRERTPLHCKRECCHLLVFHFFPGRSIYWISSPGKPLDFKHIPGEVSLHISQKGKAEKALKFSDTVGAPLFLKQPFPWLAKVPSPKPSLTSLFLIPDSNREEVSSRQLIWPGSVVHKKSINILFGTEDRSFFCHST